MIKKVGDRIRIIREEKKLTQANMGEELGMTNSAYSKIERGDVNTPLKRLLQIAEILEVNVTAFFEDKKVQINEPKTNYGYATKEELREVEYTILREIEKLREDLGVNKKTGKKIIKTKK